MTETMTASEYKTHRPKQSKYKNKHVIVGSERFDSMKEARRHQELKLLERAGEISKLERQPKFDLVVNDLKICRYIGDWRYLDHRGLIVIEDAKGFKTPAFKLKWKLCQALYPQIEWRLS